MTSLSDNMRGALFMMGAATFFAFGDACVKAIGTSMPLGQLMFLRGLLASAGIAVIAWRLGGLRLRLGRRDVGFVLGRSLAEVGAAHFFLTALLHMPIANVTALLQTVPLVVTLAGALLLKETVGWRRWTAIVGGFLGMLLIVQPGGAGFSIWAVYALIAVVFVSARDLLTRHISQETPSMTVALIGVMSVTLFGGMQSIGQAWPELDGRLGLLLVAAAAFNICAFSFSVFATRYGEIGFTAPFRYAGLVAAAGLGLVIFGEWPELMAVLGCLIIVGAGAVTMWREQVVARQAKTRRM